MPTLGLPLLSSLIKMGKLRSERTIGAFADSLAGLFVVREPEPIGVEYGLGIVAKVEQHLYINGTGIN